jgi:hypothetical protein
MGTPIGYWEPTDYDTAFGSLAAGTNIAGAVTTSGATWTQASTDGTGTLLACTAPDGTPAVYKGGSGSAFYFMDKGSPLGSDQTMTASFYIPALISYPSVLVYLDTATGNCVEIIWNYTAEELQIREVISASATTRASSSAVGGGLTVGNWYTVQVSMTANFVITANIYSGKTVTGSPIVTVTYTSLVNWVPGRCGIGFVNAGAETPTTDALWANPTAISTPRIVQVCSPATFTSTINNGTTYEGLFGLNGGLQIGSTYAFYIGGGKNVGGVITNKWPYDLGVATAPTSNWANWTLSPTLLKSFASGGTGGSANTGECALASGSVIMFEVFWPLGVYEANVTTSSGVKVYVSFATDGVTFTNRTDVTSYIFQSGWAAAFFATTNNFYQDSSGRLYIVCGAGTGSNGTTLLGGTTNLFTWDNPSPSNVASITYQLLLNSGNIEGQIAPFADGTLMAYCRPGSAGNPVLKHITGRGMAQSAITVVMNNPPDLGISVGLIADYDGNIHMANPNSASVRENLTWFLSAQASFGTVWSNPATPTDVNNSYAPLLMGVTTDGCIQYNALCPTNDGSGDKLCFLTACTPNASQPTATWNMYAMRVTPAYIGQSGPGGGGNPSLTAAQLWAGMPKTQRSKLRSLASRIR